MKVFKFGGASVKDADGVKNLRNVVQNTGTTNKVVVISAMGKTTNALESVINTYSQTKNIDLHEVVNYHRVIMEGLFPNTSHEVYKKVTVLFQEIENFLRTNKSLNYDYVYDQVIVYGELISTTIVSEYLKNEGIENTWLDARNLIKTNDAYREGKVNWELTSSNISDQITMSSLYITQGFIASDENNFSTTLGREGSDYSAAILAYCLHAHDVTIWKDVDGVYNGDPKVFLNTQKLEEISYTEAIELAFYGASVIHPKTLQPLQKREIPLYVKSFYKPNEEGTVVKRGGAKIKPYVPCFIVKNNLVLISLSAIDFSFFVEENISEVFALFHQHQIKVDLIQNSAISFSVCVDNKYNRLDELILKLKSKFKVSFNKDVSLYTIRHFNTGAINSIEKGKTILLKQLTRETVQIVAKQES
ncbi:aspartate kinase [Mesonia sp. K7]|uniref:aspartate kinase n=1 Tax=Mesonia sp. K7 TaxID=2218606 RepID=UPI000DA862AC|nr:aspartate kinase [Mesonia sp. K7]PZD78492.1 aspartate kinase [Mesonia sp. K7]